MTVIADLHIHSRYSNATSYQMELPTLAESARRKGIDLLGTGDCTQPDWLDTLRVPKYMGISTGSILTQTR